MRGGTRCRSPGAITSHHFYSHKKIETRENQSKTFNPPNSIKITPFLLMILKTHTGICLNLTVIG